MPKIVNLYFEIICTHNFVVMLYWTIKHSGYICPSAPVPSSIQLFSTAWGVSQVPILCNDTSTVGGVQGPGTDTVHCRKVSKDRQSPSTL